MARACILVIERDWRIRKLIRANLETLGMDVCEAVNGEHGLQQLQETRPDLVLLDLDLTEEDALHLLHSLHSRVEGWAAPILAMSAEPPSRLLMQQGWIAGYLLKPFAVPTLLEQIRDVLLGGPPGS